jgi:RimJ/RimL family protein N-acetyltransferase
LFRCLHLDTDGFFWRGLGVLSRRDGYWIAKYPSNLRYYWGNSLIFNAAPDAESITHWPLAFAREFPEPEVRHLTFYWDDPDGSRGCVSDFEAAGYSFESSDVLTASEVRPPPQLNDGIEIRAIESDAAWDVILRSRVEHRDPQFEERAFREFSMAQLAGYRRMIAAGRGSWYGAYAGDRLVAELGLFSEGGLARFKDIFTHPEFRLQGICGTLLYRVARQALATGLDRIAIVVDPANERAVRVYRSIGFAPVQKAVGICRYPDER